jgi:choline dehydrogenase-like flavoprotein
VSVYMKWVLPERGHEAKTSVLNKWNQVRGTENVFVTDGSCMSSLSCINPSLT